MNTNIDADSIRISMETNSLFEWIELMSFLIFAKNSKKFSKSFLIKTIINLIKINLWYLNRKSPVFRLNQISRHLFSSPEAKNKKFLCKIPKVIRLSNFPLTPTALTLYKELSFCLSNPTWPKTESGLLTSRLTEALGFAFVCICGRLELHLIYAYIYTHAHARI